MGKEIEKEKIKAKIELINSLEYRGATEIYMTQDSPKLLYRDILNPLKAELEENLKQLERNENSTEKG